ncbi:MAG: copper resistance protein CopC [Actinomycetota bacterium]
MKRLVLLAAVAGALVLPASAWAHAALLRTSPQASATVNTPPDHVALTYSEAVEPRFAIVSVTDAAGRSVTAGEPTRSLQDADELDIPLHRVPEGWYLVFWRVISADGHPVRGVFTFAVGPNPGPAPAFTVPSLSEPAATPSLVALRWAVFFFAMAAIGLLALRCGIARPLLRDRPRALAVAFWVALGVALVVNVVYVFDATAEFALRPVTDVGALLPLLQKSAFGRGWLTLELLLVLLGVAGGIALWLDRGARRRRSVAELVSLLGAALAAAAVLLVPGAAGHAAQTSPRALSIALDWLHLVAGSLWVGGLIGLLLLRRNVAALVVTVPRFSNVAFASVVVLLGTGVGASVVHLPTLSSLWDTSYGTAILVKAGLLLAAMALAAVNLLRTRPALLRPVPPASAAILLRRLVACETVLVAAAIAAAAVLSSLPPPPKALASLGTVSAHTGPGAVVRAFDDGGYHVVLHVSPNRAAMPNAFAVQLSRNGNPVHGAAVTLRFTMLDMEMPAQEYTLPETRPGTYARTIPALVMVGRWGLQISVGSFTTTVVDKAGG